MKVEKFGSKEVKEVDLPEGYSKCIYCYAASKTCNFWQEGDTHFIRVDGTLREVTCTGIRAGIGKLLSCRSITEEQVRRAIATSSAYN